VLESALSVAFLEYLDGFVVGDPGKGGFHLLELGNIATDDGEIGAAALQAALDDEGDQALR